MRKVTPVALSLFIMAILSGCSDNDKAEKKEEPAQKYEDGFVMPGNSDGNEKPIHESFVHKDSPIKALTPDQEKKLKHLDFEEYTKPNPAYDSSSALYGVISNKIVPLVSLTPIKENSDSVEFQFNSYDKDYADINDGSVHIEINKIILHVNDFSDGLVKIDKKTLARVTIDPEHSDFNFYLNDGRSLRTSITIGVEKTNYLDTLSGVSLGKYLNEAKLDILREQEAAIKAEDQEKGTPSDKDYIKS